MTQVVGMKSAPISRLPMPIPRSKASNMGYDLKKTTSAPTKLELMQRQYQEKLQREKDKRMTEINLQNEERTMRFGDGPSKSVVKDFFQERRQMASHGYTPNIEHHFTKKKAEVTGEGSTYSNQYQYKKQYGYGSKPSSQKNSAGRDKSNPLAPIEKPPRGPDVGKKSRKSSAASNGSLYSQNNNFPRKIVPLTRKNSYGSGSNTPIAADNDYSISGRKSKQPGDISEDEERNAIFSSRNASPSKKTSFKDWKDKQKRTREKNYIQSDTGRNGTHEQENTNGNTLTDFQKWQAEQDNERSQRLQKNSQVNGYRQTPPPPSHRSNASRVGSQISIADGVKSPGRAKKQLLQKHINTQSKKQLYASASSSKPVSDESDDDYDEAPNQSQEVLQKQRELEALLRKQQEELQKMKKQRETEEVQERKALEREEKRAAQQRERQRKLREAEEKKILEQEEKDRKEDQKREMDERDFKWEQEQKQAKSKQNSYGQSNYSQQESAYSQNEYDHPQSQVERVTEPYIPKKPARVKMNRNKPPPQKQRQPSPEPGQDSFYDNKDAARFYEERIAEDPESHGSVDLAPCHLCGRKFARDRLEKHSKVCVAGQKKKRKVFDLTKMRVEGTDMAQFVAENERRPQKAPPKKKNNWRSQHDNFIQTIRYAKQVTEAEKTGDISHLPAPPKTENPDYVPCPYCNRKFNEGAAQRHIPRCKDIKSRPPPMKRR